MALLTADDVHWKQFQATKFREGYDQEEVDEFLDEVVETIATLQEENETLKGQLDEARQAVASGAPVAPASSGADAEKINQLNAELEGANGLIAQLQQELQAAKAAQADMTQLAAPAAPVAVEDKAAQEQIANLQAALARSQAETNEARQYAEQARGELQQVQAQLEQAKATPAEAPVSDESQDATSMLSLAQRVHDEYVRNGQEEGDRIVSDSRAKGGQIIREAKEERQRVLDALTSERSDLESQIDQLKTFESDYRVKLSDHLRGLLEHVNSEETK